MIVSPVRITFTTHVKGVDFALGQADDLHLPTESANHTMNQCKITPIYIHCSCKNLSYLECKNIEQFMLKNT